MDTQSYKTVSLKAGDIKKEWVVIDATDLVLGRLAARVALVLRGKNKPSFTPHMDCGDNVIILKRGQDKAHRQEDDRQGVRAPYRISGRTAFQHP